MLNMPVENELLYQIFRQNRTVTAQIGAVEKLDEPTWIVTFPEYPSFRGLVPLSGAGVDEPLMYAMVGQEIGVVVKGVDQEAGIVACSRKEAVEKVAEQILSRLEVDQIIPVTVIGVVYRDRRPFLVVDVGQGVFYEMPRSKAATCYSKRLREQYRAGQAVNCKVMSIEPLELSIRDARPDPWTRADFRRGSIISGTVYNVANELVFVEPDLCMGILGLAPVPLKGNVTRGMRVSCRVRFFDPEKRKLHLWLIRPL